MTAVARKQRSARAESLIETKAGPQTAPALLSWYDAGNRDLPWRYGPDETPDPYRVWISEVMLQQTTVKAVIPYFEKFLQRWPTVKALAKADLDEVLGVWAGLGYYSRARNLYACAQVVAKNHKAKLPRSETELLKLPGIGPYTAAAISAIAFGARASPVDGNVERVVARLFAVREPMPASKPRLRALAGTLTPNKRSGDFAQAMMDLGATVCTPKRPSCLMCPLHSQCAAHALGIEETLPGRAIKGERPVRYGSAFLVLREDGHLLLRQRPSAGLLGAMLEVPSTAWGEAWLAKDEACRSAPVHADWWPVAGNVSHIFTHFRLEMQVFRALVPSDVQLHLWAEPDRCRWLHRRDLQGSALPSVMKKIIAHGLKE